MKRKNVVLAVFFLLLTFAMQNGFAMGGQEGLAKMSGADLDKIMNDTKEKEKDLVSDVRTAEEYAQGHVRYAINIVLDNLEQKVADIEDFKDKNVVTICRSGKRSQKAAELLQKKGFKYLFNADGVESYKYTTMTKVANVRGKELQAIVNAGTHSVVDFREEKDYNTSHLKGAINATVDNIMEKAAMLPKDKPVATYCYSGNRSFRGAEKLEAAGYTVVNSLDGTKEYSGFELVK